MEKETDLGVVMTFMRLYVRVAPSLHGRPGSRRAALGRAGRDETQTRGPGRADNMRHSVARHPGPGHGTHRTVVNTEKWNYCETRGQCAASCVLGTRNWLLWLKMKVWNIWNTCEWLCKASSPSSLSMFSLWLLWWWFKLCTSTTAAAATAALL